MSDLQPDPGAPTKSVDHVLGAEACEQNARKLLADAETSGDANNALIYAQQSQTWATLALGHRLANATAVIGGALGAEVAAAVERLTTVIDERPVS